MLEDEEEEGVVRLMGMGVGEGEEAFNGVVAGVVGTEKLYAAR
jgi:hypothetical protein